MLPEKAEGMLVVVREDERAFLEGFLLPYLRQSFVEFQIALRCVLLSGDIDLLVVRVDGKPRGIARREFCVERTR